MNKVLNNPEEDVVYDAASTKRIAQLRRQLALLARVYGVAGYSANIGESEKNQCRLTQDGIIISLNPAAIERLAERQWYGSQGALTLEIADFMVLTHEVLLAQDYLDPSFSLSTTSDSSVTAQTKRFFINSINDLVADASLAKVPYAKPCFSAYISRQISHTLEVAPLHIQFLIALKILSLEESPTLKAEPFILNLLSSDEHRFIDRIQGELLGKRHNYEERHLIAEDILGPVFSNLLNRDMRRYSAFQFFSIYDDFSFFGEVDDPEQEGHKKSTSREVKQRAQELYSLVSSKDIDRMLDDRNESTDAAAKEELGSGQLSLPKAETQLEGASIAQESTEGYRNTVARWFDVIQDVAQVFIELATPKESIAVPRYASRKAHEGKRLSPQALSEMLVQINTRQAQAIWQPSKRVIRTQDLQFSGLDLFLLLDLSGSMQGQNAEYASAMAVCMMEGLELARHQVELDSKLGDVDLRIQLIAFGSGWAELTPLCKEPSFAEKEQALYNLLHPESDNTMVNGALRYVSDCATRYRERELICLIVSDGLFADNLIAYKTAEALPSNSFLGHINIGEFRGIPITPNYDSIEDPGLLPMMLSRILSAYLERRTV